MPLHMLNKTRRPHNLQGTLLGIVIRMITDKRAAHGEDSVKLDGCGPFTLAEDLSDIEDMARIDLSGIDSLGGTLPGFLIRMISEGKANFEGCGGPFTLPTDLSSIEDAPSRSLVTSGIMYDSACRLTYVQRSPAPINRLMSSRPSNVGPASATRTRKLTPDCIACNTRSTT